MEAERQYDLKCTFEDAERNHLLDGIRMTTDDKIHMFESMLDFAWRAGAIKQLRESAPAGNKVERQEA